MVKNEYAKAYMEDKARIVVKENVRGKLTAIKTGRKFNSDNDTINYLCNIEKLMRESNWIYDKAKCEDCDVETDAIHVGKYHNSVDKNSECFGCFQPKFDVGPTKDKRNGTNESNDDTSEQTDTIERELTQEEKRTILEENTRKFILQRGEEEKKRRITEIIYEKL